MENKILLCPHNSCYSLPKISLLDNCSKMLITCNEHRGSYNRICEIYDYFSKEKKLLCTICSKHINENQFFFFCYHCEFLLCNKCYNTINYNHPHNIFKKSFHNFWNFCNKHNLPYINYCKNCAISFCEKCDISNHNKHIVVFINKKTEKEIEELKENLLLQEKALAQINNIMNDCLNNMKLEIKLKRLILNNYLNSENNGNSIENLSQIYSPIDKSYIDYLNNSKNISFKDKLLVPFKFYERLKGKEGKSDRQINNFNNNNIIKTFKNFKNEKDDINNPNFILNNNKGDNNKYINEQLYQKVLKHENITKDIIDIKNVEGDGNCFYRAISQFLFGDESFHQKIREEIFKEAQKREKNDLKEISLLENTDLSATNYINNIQFDGGFAGDYEISIAHKLYNINIAVYRFKDDNDLSFIRFYNDKGKNKKDLLILIYINDNHYQLAYYKINEKIKENQIGGIHTLQQNITINNSINSNCTTTQKEMEGKTRTKITDNEKKENIIAIHEQKIIYCMTRLSSGNLAIGLSNGLIKIYDVNNLCKQFNNIGYNNNGERDTLQTINSFRGKRISYIYELKDKTLLCATYGKIHHIKLIDNDRNYQDLGFIKISPKELPKRIIELQNELIISLSEKKYKHENLNRIKCLIKIFNKLNKTDSQKEDDDNSFCLFSDIESIASSNINSSVEWENVYSSNEEDSLLTNIKKNYKEDSNIKLYKNNENKDDLFICSIFPIETENRNSEYNEFIATSNKTFYGGGNCIQIYRIIKKQNKHGFMFYIKEIIPDVSCSRKVDSIIKLNNKYIGIGLQRYDDNMDDGIAILDIERKIIVRKINGLSVGSLSKSYINEDYIIFTTNETKDVKKSNLIRLYKKSNQFKDFLSKDKNKIVFQLKSGFTCIEELFYEKGHNVIYAAINDKAFYIINLKND